ncbi:D-glycero-alpha-D-manno-heptose-1,7-bisphosphate 7-phosphatase [Colwelliaceae bacterium MEBiC 14330]
MSADKIKVAFLDRDGVINKEVNYLYKIEDFEYTENCIEGLKKIKELGYEIIIVTNQAGIARGYYTEQQYQKLTDWYLNDLKQQGIDILDVYHCPHHPEGKVNRYTKKCACRKPMAGMIETAKNKYDIDMSISILVGDKLSDIESGIKGGLFETACYLVNTGHKIARELKMKVFDDLIDVSNQLNLKE